MGAVTCQLSDAQVGQSYKIIAISKELGDTQKRLQALGMTPGSTLSVLQKKRSGAIIIRLRESRWALGAPISHNIQVGHVAHAQQVGLANE